MVVVVVAEIVVVDVVVVVVVAAGTPSQSLQQNSPDETRLPLQKT